MTTAELLIAGEAVLVVAFSLTLSISLGNYLTLKDMRQGEQP